MHSKQSITDDSSSSNVHKYSDYIENEVKLPPYPRDILWIRATAVFFWHVGAIYGAYLFLVVGKWQTCLFACLLYITSALGITAGAHRLWTHKAYKAKLPLRIMLLSFHTMAMEFTTIKWVQVHRMHHKYCDTDADPHNSTRGFFFAHIGWWFTKKHPQVSAHTVDLTDVMEDPLLRFQDKYYLPLLLIVSFVLSFIPTLWGEQTWNAFFICICLRHTCIVHASGLVNSVAHMWGNRPYDKHITPVETKIISLIAVGEGFHNYHHTYPWDYRTAELGGYSLNITKLFIDIMAKIGWAYDLKTVPDELIERRVKRTGDGTHPVWGWDDPDLPKEEKAGSKINFSSTYLKNKPNS